MDEIDLKNVVKKIQNAHAEFQTVEVQLFKSGRWRSYIICLYEAEVFAVAGVDDVQELQKSVMN